MASRVPPSKTSLAEEDRPAPPTAALEQPEDWKKTFKVGMKPVLRR
jgi:hypothetical protein